MTKQELAQSWVTRAKDARKRSLVEASERERNIQIGLAAAWDAASKELESNG